MLSDLLTFVLALAVCGMAVLCVYCYRLGLRDGGFARRNGEARRRLPLRNGGGGEKESVSERGFCTAERGRTGAGILANIDAYDGTEKGQKVIE